MVVQLLVVGSNNVSFNVNYLFVFLVGHGGSDGLHGYVPSLDHVVADTVSSAEILTLFSGSYILLELTEPNFRSLYLKIVIFSMSLHPIVFNKWEHCIVLDFDFRMFLVLQMPTCVPCSLI